MMYKILRLKNFRGFSDLKITGLSKINIITGLNGSGKTSILEAAFLISGAANAGLISSLYSFRGETLWAVNNDYPFISIFRNLDSSVHPCISASSSSSVNLQSSSKYFRELTIKPSYTVGQSKASTQQASTLSGVEFVFKGAAGTKKHQWGWTPSTSTDKNKKETQTSSQNKKQFRLGGEVPDNPDFKNAHFISPYFRESNEQDNKVLTQLVKERRVNEVIKVLRILEPSIKDVMPLNENGIPIVYVDTGAEKLLPISLLGSGLSNLLHITLPLVKYKNATILIDEFEDGLHHSIFQPILTAVFSLAKNNNNQIFISTHSREFLHELIKVCNESKISDDISFFRLAKRKLEGNIPKYSYSEIESLLEADMEVR